MTAPDRSPGPWQVTFGKGWTAVTATLPTADAVYRYVRSVMDQSPWRHPTVSCTSDPGMQITFTSGDQLEAWHTSEREPA